MSVLARILLVAVLVLAAALRAWNLDAGVGTAFHPDEPHKALSAHLLATEGFGNTGYFNHPYLLLEGAVATGVGWARGPEDHHLAGRIFAALCGTLTVAAVFLLAREAARGSAAAGLAAAALLAVAPIAVVHSRWFKEDAPLSLFTTLALWLSLRALREGRPRDWALATAAAALALSTKWIGACALLLPAAAFVLRATAPGAAPLSPGKVIRSTAVLAGLAAGIFLLLDPQVLLYPDEVLADLRWEAERAGGDARGVPVSAAAWFGGFHLVRSLVPGLTLPLLAAGALGLALAARTRDRGALLLAGAALAWYGIHEASPLKPAPDAMRYMVPLAPVICAGAGLLVPVLPRRWPIVLVLAAGGFAAVRTVGLAIDARPDTRVLAAEWCAAHIPPGAVVWIDRYGPVLREGSAMDPWNGVKPPTGLAPRFLIVSSFWRDRFFERGTTSGEARVFFERGEAEDGPPVAVFQAPSGPFGFQNPVIRVYAAW